MHYEIKILNSIQEISAAQWNQLTGTDYPFLRHEFLHALEESGCTTAKTGWQCAHLLVYLDSALICIMPMYQKTNSNGEYVFDWDWADAYQQNGLDYYPKLLSAIPFSPCYGPRISSRLPLNQVLPYIKEQLVQLCQTYGFSSWHGLFAPLEQIELISDQNFLTRQGVQYHWFNENYTDFAEYLQCFTSRKRKNINKERRVVDEQKVSIKSVEGHEIDSALLKEFYYCYQLTYLRRGRKGYLNIEFFQLLLASISSQIVLFVATHQQKTVACAWCFKNTDPIDSVLYGRYWGALDQFDNLHFETCYYHGIEYCIEHKIKRFDPGAQGEHKIQRGFKPITTYSNHYIKHHEFKSAIEHYLQRETVAIKEHKQHLSRQLPFKQ